MRKESISYASKDKINQVYATKWIPDGEVKGIVQIVHGMAEHIDRYDDFATKLVEEGYLVVGDDHLGHGRTGEHQGIYGYFCAEDPATVVVEDEHSLRELMQQEYPDVNYYILGHSMGSFITRNYICAHGDGLSGVVISGTGMQAPALLGVGRVLVKTVKTFHGGKYISKLIDGIAFSAYNAKIEKPVTEFDWLSVNEENVEKYIADPWCGFKFTVNGFETLFELIHRLHDVKRLDMVPKNLPLYYVAGDADPVGEYGKGVKVAADMLSQRGVSDIQIKLYPGLRHEILNEKENQMVYEDIINWIQTHRNEK